MIDDSPVVTEQVAASDDAHSTGWARRIPSVTSILAALLAVGLLAGAGWTGLEVRQVRQDNAADDAALDAGREAAVAFTSYDYRHLGEDLRRVEDMSTGRFRDQFTEAMGSLTESISSAKGVSVGRVVYAGLRERSENTAVVLAAIDASITNTSSPRPSTRRYRLQITLNDETGRWLIADVAPVT